MKPTIGVLAVQGSFAEHIESFGKLDVNCIEIRQKSDLTNHQLQGIVLPGGESTVMGKLLHELDLFAELKQLIENGLPILGTCAGLILLAKTIVNDATVYLGTMDITARRNAYGRQLGSFSTQGNFSELGEIPMTFIRAPFIDAISANVEVLAKINGHIVAARQNNMVVTSFHPELSSDLSVHRYFLDLCD